MPVLIRILLKIPTNIHSFLLTCSKCGSRPTVILHAACIRHHGNRCIGVDHVAAKFGSNRAKAGGNYERFNFCIEETDKTFVPHSCNITSQKKKCPFVMLHFISYDTYIQGTFHMTLA